MGTEWKLAFDKSGRDKELDIGRQFRKSIGLASVEKFKSWGEYRPERVGQRRTCEDLSEVGCHGDLSVKKSNAAHRFASFLEPCEVRNSDFTAMALLGKISRADQRFSRTKSVRCSHMSWSFC
jgi:hypothetical protein